MRAGLALVGALGIAAAEEHCSDALDAEACVGKIMAGMDCVWSDTAKNCGTREEHKAAIWGWEWDGVMPAYSTGTATSYVEDGHATHYNSFENHAWEEAVEYGEIRTFIRSDDKGRPTAVGVSIPTDLDEVFPLDEKNDPGGRFSLSTEHRCSSSMPFNHFQVNYITHGHPGGFEYPKLFEAFPKGMDAVNQVIGESTWFQRHFDIHLHLDTPEESNAITCSFGQFPPCMPNPEEKVKFDNVPAPEYIPAGMVKDPLADVPFMGSHWANLMGTEWDEFRDDYAPVFGTFDGRVAYWEAMITATSLEGLTVDAPKEYEYVVPEKVQVTGYYPTKLAMRKQAVPGAIDNKEVYLIEFYDMEFRIGDDIFESMMGLAEMPTEDDFCPPIDCTKVPTTRESGAKEKGSEFEARKFCSSCGTHGVKAFGKRPKGVKPTKVHNSCECMAYCKDVSEGYKFQQKNKALKKGKKGRCSCLANIRIDSDFNAKYTSAVF